jgi:transposase-like protein
MSLAALAMSNQVNANQLRRWVQLHGNHRAGPIAAATLLPVTVATQEVAVREAAVHEAPAPAALGIAAVAVEVELAGAVVRVRDGVAPATLRMVLACVRGTAP